MSDPVPYLDGTEDGAVLSTFGWCQTAGKPDHYHTLCRREYRTTFGVIHRCACANHRADDGEDA